MCDILATREYSAFALVSSERDRLKSLEKLQYNLVSWLIVDRLADYEKSRCDDMLVVHFSAASIRSTFR